MTLHPAALNPPIHSFVWAKCGTDTSKDNAAKNTLQEMVQKELQMVTSYM